MQSDRAASLIFWLLPVWLVLQLCVFAVIGVQSASDTGRYLAGADALLAGTALPGKSGSYLGYNLFVAVFRFAGLGSTAVVLGQILLAGIACISMYFIGVKLAGPRAGLAAAALYAVYPDVQMWNFYILTESVFISMLIISTGLLVHARGPGGYLIAAPVILFTMVVRPNGVILAVAVFAFIVFRMIRQRRYGLLLALGVSCAIGAAFAVGALSDRLAHENIGAHLREGTVIWGYQGLRLPMALDAVPEAGHVGIAELIGLMAVDPPGFIRLFLVRIAASIVHARPYWSLLHNAFTLITLAAIYFYAWRGVRQSGPGDVVVLALSMVAAQGAVVGATFADWDGRHLAAVLPMVFLMAAPALASSVGGLSGTVRRCSRGS